MAEDRTPDDAAGKGSPWRNTGWLMALAAVLAALGACLGNVLDKLADLLQALQP